MNDIFNVHTETEDDLKIADATFELLKIKYHLIVTDDSPMRIEKR